jgi:hypothetical protein
LHLIGRAALKVMLSNYVALIERGEYWPEERIAYNEDVTRAVTCTHLQPVERAMRDAGIEARLQARVEVKAACRISRAAFDQAFGTSVSARYVEWRDTDRHSDGPYVASLWCQPCAPNIFVGHPQEAQSQTPWFPPQA